jgi:ATP-dependent helicase YprA (DUF1998 family)
MPGDGSRASDSQISDSGSVSTACQSPKGACRAGSQLPEPRRKRLISGFFAPSQPGEDTPASTFCRTTSIHQHMKPSKLFHPAVANWFGACFKAPTPAQARAWPAIKAGQHTLVAAPTGSGKTLAAFLAAIDDLIRQGLSGTLADETQVVYVSPLKALSNDIHRNLEVPLAGISEQLRRGGCLKSTSVPG